MNAAWTSLRRIAIMQPPSMPSLAGVREAAAAIIPPPPIPPLDPASIGFATARSRERLWGALWGSAVILLYLVAAYTAVYELFPRYLQGNEAIYVAQPIVWTGLAALAFVLWFELPDRPAINRFVIGLAVFAAGFQISFLVLAGVLYGFGSSPYTGEAMVLAKNGLYVVTLLAGLEMARAYLLYSWGRINMPLAFAVVALLFAAVNIPVAQFDLGGDRELAFETIGSGYLPSIAGSVVATLFAALGGPIASFAYMAGLAAFEWYSPILPDLDWTVRAFVYTLAPLLVLLVARDIHASWTSEADDSEELGGDLSAWWMAAGVVIVAAIWLNTGMLGVQPALVSGPSMEPSLRALDVVFTQEVDAADLEVGDIIRYERTGVSIVHRIVEIPKKTDAGYITKDGDVLFEENGATGPVFITQGDANNATDPPVLADEIEGKVVFDIPKVGWLPNQVKQLIDKVG